MSPATLDCVGVDGVPDQWFSCPADNSGQAADERALREDVRTSAGRRGVDRAGGRTYRSATGGMVPKLENLISLLDRGVRSAHVISGTTRNAILAEVFTDEGTGTMLVKSEPPAVAGG